MDHLITSLHPPPTQKRQRCHQMNNVCIFGANRWVEVFFWYFANPFLLEIALFVLFESISAEVFGFSKANV